MSPRLVLRSGAFAAFSAAFLLGWQFWIALPLGDEITLLSQSLDPVRMTSFFQMDARAVTQLMTADDGFAIAYAIAFVALAFYVMSRSKLLGTLALVFSMVTALTDLSENSLTLVALQTVAQNLPLEPPTLALLFWLGQVKFLSIYLGAILFAIGVWKAGTPGKVFALLLLLFPLIGVSSIAVEALVLVKVLWMFVLLIAGGVFLVITANQTSKVSETFEV